MGVVLIQQRHPITYFSIAFCPWMQNALTYTRELRPIARAVKCWRQYYMGTYFVLQTNHQSLKELLTQVGQTLEQQHYLANLLGV